MVFGYGSPLPPLDRGGPAVLLAVQELELPFELHEPVVTSARQRSLFHSRDHRPDGLALVPAFAEASALCQPRAAREGVVETVVVVPQLQLSHTWGVDQQSPRVDQDQLPLCRGVAALAVAAYVSHCLTFFSDEFVDEGRFAHARGAQ